MKEDKKAMRALKIVVDYLWNDEQKHYEESDKPKGHIFESLKILRNFEHKKITQKRCSDCRQVLQEFDGKKNGICWICRARDLKYDYNKDLREKYKKLNKKK